MLVEDLPGHRNRRPRRVVLLALAATATLVHVLLLRGTNVGKTHGAAPPLPAPAVQVRSVSVAPAVVEPPVAKHALRPPRLRAAAPMQEMTSGVPPPDPAPHPADTDTAFVDEPAVAATTSEPSTAASTPPQGDDEVPVYRTLMPPASTLHYELRRGYLSGSGDLVWRPAGQHYELRLEGRVAGVSVMTQLSRGGLDDAGIAPLRYTDQRVRRGVSAANFQRDRGKVSFSGPSTEYPLPAGAQDRLSWMIQLAAVAAAEPTRMVEGARVAMFVVGARGEADVWVFRVVNPETISTDIGPVRAVKFTREPRRPYDTSVEIWLDPARHHLPVRAKMTSPPGNDSLELSLREWQSP